MTMHAYGERGLSFHYKTRLKITETFLSLQGEGQHSGLPCTFVRLTGCGLRCRYCDTSYAFHGGAWRSFDDLFHDIAAKAAKLIQITGGEPLHQKAVWPFIDDLIARGYRVLIETGGHVSIAGLHPAAHIVLDLKTPESGESEEMVWANLDLLKASDEIKFVVCSASDLEWSFEVIREHKLDERFHVLISPMASLQDKASLADRVIASGLHVRFQVQLHKVLWGDVAGK